MEENVLILGAASDMAVAIARKFASEGYSITLAGRNPDRLNPLEADLKVRYKGNANVVKFDALDLNSHQNFYDTLPEEPNIVICVFGLLGDQKDAEKNWKACEEILFSNYIGAVSILNIVANDFEKKKKGTIV